MAAASWANAVAAVRASTTTRLLLRAWRLTTSNTSFPVQGTQPVLAPGLREEGIPAK